MWRNPWTQSAQKASNFTFCHVRAVALKPKVWMSACNKSLVCQWSTPLWGLSSASWLMSAISIKRRPFGNGCFFHCELRSRFRQRRWYWLEHLRSYFSKRKSRSIGKNLPSTASRSLLHRHRRRRKMNRRKAPPLSSNDRLGTKRQATRQ